jgi:hypothetical protein
MSELNKDDIIKAIESHRNGKCHNCPYEGLPRCLDILCENTVKFINELTVENERLRAENDRSVVLMGSDNSLELVMNLPEHLMGHCDPTGEDGVCGLFNKCQVQTKADTVRKMHEMVKERASKAGNRYANGETVIIQYCISPEALDQIAKEMLEGNK